MGRCPSCGDDEDRYWVHHQHDPEETDCYDEEGYSACHTVCGNCDYGLCGFCGE